MIIQKSLASSWLVCFLVASKGLNKGLSRQTVNGPSSVILGEPIHAAMYFSVSADEGQASSDVSQCRQTDISPTTGWTLNMTGVHQKDIRQDQPTHHMLGWAGNTDQFSSEFHIVCACRNLLLFQHDETEKRGDVLEVTGAPALLSSRRLDSTVPTTERGWKESGLVCLCIHPPIGRSRWSWSLLRCPPPVK